MPKQTLDPEGLTVESYATTQATVAAEAQGPLVTRVTSCPGGPPYCTC